VDEPDVFAVFTAIGLRDAWPRGPGFTNPTGAIRQRLDRVLLGAALSAEAIQVPVDGPEWVRRSDHLPVIATIR
jgi:endonuclease/exonuclease/phosphatase family metal-dependent hydrolase